MSQGSEVHHNLIEECQSWTDRQFEDQLQDLLSLVRPVLLDNDSEPELRLDCVRITADKIARFVPVFEAEENVFFPFLNAVNVFLGQVLERLDRTEEESRVMVISLARALVEHTSTLVLHAASFSGLGPGEIPSIPRMVPKILMSIFQYCSKEQDEQNSDEVRASIKLLYVKGRTLLESFVSLVDKMKIRTALEDELDILVILCADLLAFHEVLFAMDLKASFAVWKLYGKLLKDNYNKLRSKLDVEATLVVLLKEILQTCQKLESFILEPAMVDFAKKMNRGAIALVFLMKITINIAEQYRNNVRSEFETFIQLLGFMFLKGENLFPHLDASQADKLQRELFLHSPVDTLIKIIPDEQLFVDHILTTRGEPSDAFARLQILVHFIENPTTECTATKSKLVDSVMEMYGFCEEECQGAPFLESVELSGRQVERVGCHEWLLTRLCRCIAIVDCPEFGEMEEVVFKHLVGESNLSRQLSCDLLCFIGRYGSAGLCLSHLKTVCDLYLALSESHYSNLSLWLGTLIGRLFNFLGPAEQGDWAQAYSPGKKENLSLWSLVDISVVQDTATVDLLQQAVQSRFNELACHSSTEQVVCPNEVGNLLHLMNGFQQVSHRAEHTHFALSFWDKLADLEILPSQQLYVMKLITRLANFTTTIIPKLSRTEIVSLVSCLRTFTSSVAKIDDSPAFLVAIAIEILTTISDLEWITQIENVDPCLVTDIGTLTSNCMKSAVRNPVVKRPGLTYLRNLAERSDNPGFLRLCIDESDVVPHFKQFLKDENSTRSVDYAKETFDYSAPGLEDLLNRAEEPEPDLKRRISTTKISTRSPPRKRPRPVAADEMGAPPPAELLATIDDKLSQLEASLANGTGMDLSEIDKQNLSRIVDRMNILLES